MIPSVDYHMHTPLCGHAIGEPFEYAEQALKTGLTEIGFSDHAPFIKGPLPGITMSSDELPLYHRMIENVRGEYAGRLTIKMGIEADFIPGYEEKTRQMLSQYHYDFVYGSVHFIDDWAFDNPDELQKWREKDIDVTYQAYFRILRQAAESGLFDIIAHFDLVKKFGYRPHIDISSDVRKTAKVFKEHGIVVEINTSGLRKEVGEIYPSIDILTILNQEGVDLTFGSDAHISTDVGRDFDQGKELALAAGYVDYVTFKDRHIESRLPLS